MKRADFSFASPKRGSSDGPASSTVLVCEDDAQLRMLLEFMLSANGYRVLTAAGGEEALRVAESAGEIGVLVTDVELPSMSGPDLIRELQTKFPALGVLVISGYPADAVPGASPSTGYAFLQKPFDEDTLVDAIERLRGSAHH